VQMFLYKLQFVVEILTKPSRGLLLFATPCTCYSDMQWLVHRK